MYYFKQTYGRTIGDKYILIIIDKASKTQAMDRTTGNSPVMPKLNTGLYKRLPFCNTVILSDMTKKLSQVQKLMVAGILDPI